MPDEAVNASLDARIAKAERAKRDLAVVKPRLDSLREGYIGVWKGSAAADVASREQAWLAYQAVDAVERQFRSDIDDGKAAASEKGAI